MRFIQTVVSSVGFRDHASNPDRLALLDKFFQIAVSHNSRLIELPAAFLTARNQREMHDLINEVQKRAVKEDVAVIGGIDIEEEEDTRQCLGKGIVSARGLPYYGFAVGPLTIQPSIAHPWQQTSTNRNNALDVSNHSVPGEDRLVNLGGVSLAVILCGEIHSARVRQSINQLRPSLVLDLGHAGMGIGTIKAMTRVSIDCQCVVALAQHLAGKSGKLHFTRSGGEREPILATTNGLLRQADLWAGWATREL